MKHFDHRGPSAPTARWDDLVAGCGDLPLFARDDHLVVLAAHPDDETLGAGGLIASAAASGCAVTVVVATDGDASHPDSPTHTPGRLAGVRRRELYAAVTVLAPGADVHLLGLPDGRLAEFETELGAAVAKILGGHTHLVTPWARDGHPDHEAAARAGGAAAAAAGALHWQYPIWAWHWGGASVLDGQQLRALRLDEETLATKRRALACHVSQHRPLSDEPGDEVMLAADMLAHFERPAEVFVVAPVRASPPLEYFDDLYAHNADPWGLDARFYEQRKRAALLAALTRPRFRRAFEPGCATGVLTADLARRCDHVVAWDVIATAAERTAARCADQDGVSVSRGAIPDEWPDGLFDLVIISEVGYYCADLAALTARIDESLAPDGVLVGCHWRHAASMHLHTAGDVHAALGTSLHLVVTHVEDDFLLQVWTRSGESVAAAEGILA
ncbi:MAG: PIG-L family deacetylase [Jatrophihabitans sp.]